MNETSDSESSNFFQSYVIQLKGINYYIIEILFNTLVLLLRQRQVGIRIVYFTHTNEVLFIYLFKKNFFI